MQEFERRDLPVSALQKNARPRSPAAAHWCREKERRLDPKASGAKCRNRDAPPRSCDSHRCEEDRSTHRRNRRWPRRRSCERAERTRRNACREIPSDPHIRLRRRLRHGDRPSKRPRRSTGSPGAAAGPPRRTRRKTRHDEFPAPQAAGVRCLRPARTRKEHVPTRRCDGPTAPGSRMRVRGPAMSAEKNPILARPPVHHVARQLASGCRSVNEMAGIMDRTGPWLRGARAVALKPLRTLIEASCSGRRAPAWRRQHGSPSLQKARRRPVGLDLSDEEPARAG